MLLLLLPHRPQPADDRHLARPIPDLLLGLVQVRGPIRELMGQSGHQTLVNRRQVGQMLSGNAVIRAYRGETDQKRCRITLALWIRGWSDWACSAPPYPMDEKKVDLQQALGEMHEELILGVLEDLKNGDRKARAEAMALLKQNNVTAASAEGSTLRQIAGKLDFSGMADKVVELKRPPVAG
jgi:hypothetical protein